ncbi:MAG: hypothetical protein KGO49_04330 [Gammaproteobacteria bacterium]|nr:hypothetical protein [Gammaproteobacteria bacterium]
MNFVIREPNGFIPELTYGQKGRELECFIPDGYEWVQLNYGQGEGEVKLSNNTIWGFFYGEDYIAIYFYSGNIDLASAIEFIEKVAKKIFQETDCKFNIYLKAVDSL